MEYWVKRFDRLEVKHTGIKEQFGKKTLSFVDFDDQQYQMISDENNKGVASGIPWQRGPIPLEYAITGLGPIYIRIAQFDYIKEILEKVLLFTEIGQEGPFHLFEVGEGGNGAQVIVEKNIVLPQGRQGFGTVHHAAFRVEDRAVLEEWIADEKLWFSNIRLCRSFLFRVFIFKSCTRNSIRIGHRWSRIYGR